MSKPTIIIPLLLQLIMSCTFPDQPAVNVRKDFVLPVVVQGPAEDTIEYLKADFLGMGDFRFAGKSKFSDTLLLDKDGFLRDTTSVTDILQEYSGPAPKDSLATDGFQIFPDYNASIHYKDEYFGNTLCYFPVYVVNETSSTKIFLGKDSHVFAIQEAIDTTGGGKHWRPIEAKGYDFCGNGDFGIKVHPGEFVMFLVPKYQGNEKNAMRIRLKIGESLYISRFYDGTFSARQFNISNASWFYRYLGNEKNRISYESFYGAIPKGYDPY